LRVAATKKAAHRAAFFVACRHRGSHAGECQDYDAEGNQKTEYTPQAFNECRFAALFSFRADEFSRYQHGYAC
jgi:hypothetical protein